MAFQIGAFVLTEDEVLRRKAYLQLTEQDEQRLRAAHPLLQAHASAVIDRFYDSLLAHEHTRRILEPPGLLERLKRVQTTYFAELTSGDYGLAYFENRLRVGLAHQRVGLAPEWYMGAYDKYLEVVSEVLRDAFASDVGRYAATLRSLTKVVHLDMNLTLEAYFLSAQDGLERKAAALEQANQEVMRFEAGRRQLTEMVVHDLQNPLAGVTAFLEVLRGELIALGPTQRDALDEALKRCDDLAQMILNVLHVSRAETGVLEPVREAVDLAELAHHAVSACRPVAEREGRGLALDAPGPVPIVTDQSLVLRIVGNLLRNAVRHTPAGTRIVVRVARDADGARVSVTDDGAGIPAALHGALFDPSGLAALRSAGLCVDSGLGLAFCRIAAEALGASLTVESDTGRGTTFILSFGG